MELLPSHLQSTFAATIAVVLVTLIPAVALFISARQMRQAREDHVFNAYENYHFQMLAHPTFARGIRNLQDMSSIERERYLVFVLYVMTLDERILRLFSERKRKKDEFAKGYDKSVDDDVNLHAHMLASSDFVPYRSMFTEQLSLKIDAAVGRVCGEEALVHHQLLVSANLGKTPSSKDDAEGWLKKLCCSIDMKILVGPFSSYSDDECNRGLTIGAVITTSHIVAHFWENVKPLRLELDIYSCKRFDLDTVFKELSKFEPSSIQYKFVDRSTDLITAAPRTP